ncbi:MAG: polysaccharide biosynthesis tyrosine autokinase [Planctomycetota bacterium]|nr:polysaccharide biosynthesis tyrosine autokinase [Planctomycetota bacterium]
MELKDYLRMLRKGWYWFLVTFVAVYVVDSYVIRQRHVDHEATAEVLVRFQQFTPWDLIPPGGQIRRPYINLETRVTGLTRFPVFEAAVELLRDERPYRSGEVPEALQKQSLEEIKRLEQQVLADAPETDFGKYLMASIEEAISKIERKAGAKDQIVPIRARARSPALAMAFANAQAEAAYQVDEEDAREITVRALEKVRAGVKEALAVQVARERERLAFAEDQGVYSLQTLEESLLDAKQRLEEEQAELRTKLSLDRERIRDWLRGVTRERLLGVSVFAAGELESQLLQALGRDLEEARKELHQLLNSTPAHKETSPARQKAEAAVKSFENGIQIERARLLDNKRSVKDREMSNLMSESRLLDRKITLDLEERKQEKENALQHLSVIRIKSDRLDRELSDSRREVKDLTATQRELERVERELEGPVVFYSHAQTSRPVAFPGKGPVARLFLLGCAALILGLGIVYFLEYVDTRVMTLQDVRRYLDLPILGVIHREKGSPSLLDLPLDHVLAEKFNTAATLVQSAADDRDMKTLMVVSTNEGEGKTTFAVNLGVALARKGRKVILLDGDLRRPGLHLLLGVENEFGLTRLVADRSDPTRLLEDLAAAEDLAGYEIDPYIQPTGVDNLSIVPSGPLPDNPPLTLESPYMGVAIRALAAKADFVIIDTPPLNVIGDALSLARHVGGTIFVVGAGRLENHEASWAKSLLKSVNAQILGVMLNFATAEPRDYYYYIRGQKSTRRHRV